MCEEEKSLHNMSQELKQGQTNNFYWPDSVCKVISDSVLLSPECQLWAWLPSLSFSSFLYHLCFLLCYTGQLTTDSSCCMVIWYHMGQVFILGSPVASLELFLERIIFISRRGIGFFPPHPKGIDMGFPPTIGSLSHMAEDQVAWKSGIHSKLWVTQ